MPVPVLAFSLKPLAKVNVPVPSPLDLLILVAVAAGLAAFLVYWWRKRCVTLHDRHLPFGGPFRFPRDSKPIRYWTAMTIYGLAECLIITCLYKQILLLLSKS